MFGIQVYSQGKWCNVHENGYPLIFADRLDCEIKRAEIRKRKELA